MLGLRCWPPGLRLPLEALALLLFLSLAGAQPSVVRAVLMAAMALLIREAGHHGRAVGVLLLTLSGMLLASLGPSIGFQLSAMATAGLVDGTSPRAGCSGVAAGSLPGPGSSVVHPCGGLALTPLRLLRFGAMPVCLVANLLVGPLLVPLTLLAMLSALLVLVMPPGAAGAVARLSVGGPGDQHGRRDQPLAWGTTAHRTSPGVGRRCWCWAYCLGCWAQQPPALVADPGHGLARSRPGAVRRWFGGGGAVGPSLVAGSPSWARCRVTPMAMRAVAGWQEARRCARPRPPGLGDARPVATDVLSCCRCWPTALGSPARPAPIAIGQVLRAMACRCSACSPAWSTGDGGSQRWQLPKPSSLWALQHRQRSEPRQLITGTWLGFKPSAPQRRWLRSMERVTGSSAFKVLGRPRAWRGSRVRLIAHDSKSCRVHLGFESHPLRF